MSEWGEEWLSSKWYKLMTVRGDLVDHGVWDMDSEVREEYYVLLELLDRARFKGWSSCEKARRKWVRHNHEKRLAWLKGAVLGSVWSSTPKSDIRKGRRGKVEVWLETKKEWVVMDISNARCIEGLNVILRDLQYRREDDEWLTRKRGY